ncbi:MAG: hypothetical protein WEF50_10710 [Myxococcota bacterium]
MAEFDKDLRDVVAMRKRVEEHIESARDARFLEKRHYKDAAELLCKELSVLVERSRIWSNIEALPAAFPQELGDVLRDLEDVLVSLGCEPRIASRVVDDVLSELDRAEGAEPGLDGARLNQLVRRATEKICEGKRGSALKQAWLALRGAVLASGVVVVGAGVASNNLALVVLGAGIVASNAKAILAGFEHLK